MKHISIRSYRFSTLALLVLLTIVVGLSFTGRASAASSPLLKHHIAPAIRRTSASTLSHNPLLNVTADEGDIYEPAALPPALCATYTTNPYHNPAPNVDQIVGDTTVTVGTQTGCKSAQNETTIAANPFNPFNLVAGTNDYRVYNARENRNDGSGWAYTTMNGGKTWKNIELPHLTYQTGATGALSDMDSAGDPALSFGPNNTVYYANLVFSRLNAASGVVVSISHNGGITWSEPSIVRLDGVDASGNPVATPIFNDKEWVAVDPRDSRTAYVTWTQFYSDASGNTVKSPVVVSTTHNGGASWSAPVEINPAFTPGGITEFSSGTNPQVDRHGNLYVAYESAVCQTLACNAATDHDEVIVAKSTDQGKTFTNAQVDIDYDFPNNPHVGRATLTGENFRINSFPQLTIDRITNRLYVTWADDRNGQYDAQGNSIKTNGDAILAASNNGTTWNREVVIGSSQDEVFPAVAALGGFVAVTFYTRHYDPNGINLDYGYARLFDFGFGQMKKDIKYTFIKRITTQSENPQVQFVAADALDPTQSIQGVFIGDYTAVAVSPDGRIHPCWTDFRGNPGVTLPNQDSYSQALPIYGF